MSPRRAKVAPARSLLYVPGDRPGWVEKAEAAAAEVVIIDLEDAVAPASKPRARAEAAAALGRRSQLRSSSGQDREVSGPSLWVRLDASGLEADLDAVCVPGLDAVVVPKVEPALLERVERRLVVLEAERRLRTPVGVVGLVETACGVRDLDEIAEHPRVVRLGLGEADLSAELGLVPGAERAELAPIRSRVVVASAAAGLERPIGPVHTTLADDEGLRRTCAQQYRQGFRGRTAIHPQQVSIINEEFAPSPREVDEARRVLALFEGSATTDVTALADRDGRLLDPATVRRAREIVTEADEAPVSSRSERREDA